MGKYEKYYKVLGDTHSHDEEEYFLWIANELAEANRLKRYELNKHIPKWEDELVDEA